MKFDELNINNKIKKALKELGYINLTEVQEKTIPYILDGFDVIAQSKTGTGKTGAFLLPIIHNIELENKKVQALILCPTRELVMQVNNELLKFSKYLKGIEVLSVYGGQELKKQIIPLRRGVHIVVSTPGRIIDHIKRKTIKLENVNTIILDEADEMLKMGFEEDVDKIFSSISTKKQVLLFSATMTDKVKEVAKKYTSNPINIKISEDELTCHDITQYAVDIKTKMKKEAVSRFIDKYMKDKAIIFCNTKKQVDELYEYLNNEKYSVMLLHSDIRQEQRSITMKRFREGKINVLVATDVAARGIDVPEVDLVINYDLPIENEAYIHRIGRTGRNESKGVAITFTVGKEKNRLNEILDFAKCKSIEYINVPTLNEVSKIKTKVDIQEIQKIISKNEFKDLDGFNKLLQDNNNDYEKLAKAMYTLIISEENTLNVEKGKFITLFLNAGKQDSVKAKDIVGAIANNTALKGTDIGKIDVKDKYSFVEVPNVYVDEVIYKLSGSKIKGKKIEIEISK